ncbi:hypothetical protein BH18ACI5_BH18ACI5_13660 [soil metagenome]
MFRTAVTLAALVFSTAACMHAQGNAAPGSTSDLRTIAAFNQRVKDYAALHNRLEATLPSMPKDAEGVDKHQRALEQLMVTSRKAAQRGDIFTLDADRLFSRLLGQVFAGPDGGQLKASIMDENPTSLKLAVNGRYPDGVPLPTMPPQVLALLPRLPPELEYRFIGNRLVLLDIHAHTVVDFIDNVLPK